MADEQSHTATLVVAPEPNGGCVLPPHVDDLPVILTNPALVACTDSVMAAAPVAYPPEQPAPAPADTNLLYVEHGTLAGEPDAMGEAAWMNLLAQLAPIGLLLDPGAIAAWAVDGLCEVHVEELPPSECADDDDEAIIADEARILTYRAQHTACSVTLTLQDGSGATKQTLSTHSHVRDVIAQQKPVQQAEGCRAVVYEGGACFDPDKAVVRSSYPPEKPVRQPAPTSRAAQGMGSPLRCTTGQDSRSVLTPVSFKSAAVAPVEHVRLL